MVVLDYLDDEPKPKAEPTSQRTSRQLTYEEEHGAFARDARFGEQHVA